MATTVAIQPREQDPSELGWPPTLPIELAMRVDTPKNIFQAYGLDKTDYDRLAADPAFQKAVEEAIETLKKDGMSFKVKAKLQSEALLARSWELIHAPNDQVPAAVQADLIKFTIKAAGLDASQEQKSKAQAGLVLPLQINLNLGD